MEVLSKGSTNSVSVIVVRQFSPSRIERQVLTQVFELVCGQRPESGESHSDRSSAVASHRVHESDQATEGVVAGRRAA